MLSSMEISMVRNMMRINGNKHISEVLELDIEEVNKTVMDIYQETGIVPKQLVLDQIERDKLEWRQELQKANLQRKLEREKTKEENKLRDAKAREDAKLLRQNERDNRKLIPKIKVKKVKAVLEKPVKQSREADLYHAQRKKEFDRRKYQTVEVNLTQMQSVRIDDRTTIFIKPGENALEARMAYLDREKIKKQKIFSDKKL